MAVAEAEVDGRAAVAVEEVAEAVAEEEFKESLLRAVVAEAGTTGVVAGLFVVEEGFAFTADFSSGMDAT